MKLLVLVTAMIASIVLSPARAQPDRPPDYLCWETPGEGTYTLDCVVPSVAEPTATATATATIVPTSTPTVVPTATLAPTSTPAGSIPANVRVVPLQYSTIGEALEGIPQGHIVVLQSGVYREQATVKVDGVTIMSVPGETAIIDGECTRDYGIVVEANDVKVRNLAVRQTVQSSVLIHLGKARATIDSNTLTNFNCTDVHYQYAAGVAVWYAGPGHKITGNTMTRRVSSTGPAAGQGNGIWFKSSSTDVASGGGHVISDNTITGGYDGIGGEVEGDSRGGVDRNTLITRNTIRQCGDDGIQVEGGGQSVTVSENTIEECGVGIAFATPLTGPLTVERNTIRSTTRGLLNVLACFKAGRQSSAVIVVRDNDCTVGSTTQLARGFQQTNSGAGVWQITGNRFRVHGYVIETTSMAGPGSTLNNNCYEAKDPTQFIKWAGVRYSSLSAFQTATGLDSLSSLGPC